MRHSHYLHSHEGLSSLKVQQNVIRSRDHKLGTYHERRIGLSPYDLKRYVRGCNIKTHAFGHYNAYDAECIAAGFTPQASRCGKGKYRQSLQLTTHCVGDANNDIANVDDIDFKVHQ